MNDERMTVTMADVNTHSTIAPLRNVVALMTMIQRLKERNVGLDAFGVFSGYSGYGKSFAATYAINSYDEITYLEIGSTWTKRDFLKRLCLEAQVSVRARASTTEMLDAVIEALADSDDTVLIFDEADRLLERKLIEIVRDLHSSLQIPVILIGEERLPTKLKAPEYERVDNRVLEWQLALPCNLDDARQLAKVCVGDELMVTDELLKDIIAKTEGRARRIASTLFQVASTARQSGAEVMDLHNYGGPIHTGAAPSRTRAARSKAVA